MITARMPGLPWQGMDAALALRAHHLRGLVGRLRCCLAAVTFGVTPGASCACHPDRADNAQADGQAITHDSGQAARDFTSHGPGPTAGRSNDWHPSPAGPAPHVVRIGPEGFPSSLLPDLPDTDLARLPQCRTRTGRALGCPCSDGSQCTEACYGVTPTADYCSATRTGHCGLPRAWQSLRHPPGGLCMLTQTGAVPVVLIYDDKYLGFYE